MALCRIALHTHHRDRIAKIQNPMQVASKVRSDNVFVIPAPDCLTRSCLQCAGTNVTRNAPFPKMKISYACTFQSFLQVALAQIWPIHTDWIVADIYDTLDSRAQEDTE
jgi:hypothetical protein